AEMAADIRYALDTDLPAHQFDQLATDGQPESGAAKTARGGAIRLHERHEQTRYLLFGETNAVIVQAHHQQILNVIAPVSAEAAPPAAAIGELERIIGEIQQYLTQPLAITQQDIGQVIGDFQLQPQALLLRFRLQQADHIARRFAGAVRNRFNRQFAGFDF